MESNKAGLLLDGYLKTISTGEDGSEGLLVENTPRCIQRPFMHHCHLFSEEMLRVHRLRGMFSNNAKNKSRYTEFQSHTWRLWNSPP